MSSPVIRRQFTVETDELRFRNTGRFLWRGGEVRVIYYSVIAVFVGWGGVALYLAQPRYPL